MSMGTGIALSQICDYFHVDLELVMDFADFGLYPTLVSDGQVGVAAQSLERLGKIISLHKALGINKEGIEVVLALRERVSELQLEIERLQNEVAGLKQNWGSEDPEALERLGLLIEIDPFA
jgi:uncharacterized small protein (DUF1192 family)